MPSALCAQQVTLSGYLKDAKTGEGLIGATIYVEELKSGTSSNVYGYYSLSVKPGTYNLKINYLGYKQSTVEIELTSNTTRDFELTPEGMNLEAVDVTAERADKNVTSVEMSVEKMDSKTIKEIPQFMGEADVIRSVQLLPGVSSVGEGATGFNVRGGNIDQNLVLLDEATVFNSSHLFGFFSVFNADAVKDLKLYKGGIPAKYGGRLSSVLDVRQKEGNKKNFSMSGGLGLISSRLLAEGPIIQDKMSFMVAGRRTYGDLFAPIFNSDLQGDKLYFYDINAKVNYTLDPNNRLFLSAYSGRDRFSFGDDFQAGWGNTTTTLRWNHLFGPKLFSNVSLIYSDYDYSLSIPEGVQSFEWISRIRNYNVKADMSYFPNVNHTLEFGVNGIYHRFFPGTAKGLTDNSIFNRIEVQTENAYELAGYVSHEWKATDWFTMKYGVRYSHFMNVGERDVFIYENGNPVSQEAITDTVSYGSGEVIDEFGGFEPRFSANIKVGPSSSIKTSYNLTRQYLHLVSNTTAATPLDIWMPAGKYIEPARAHQVALGYFRNFSENVYEASVEAYYKKYFNLLDYKNGAELLLNESLETELLSGDGRAYGLEFQVKKNKGRFTGWISYTLARTELQVPGVNNGEYYPSNYDKTHDVTLVTTYRLNEKWLFSGIFSYMTGRPYTYPDSRYVVDGRVIPNYSNRNGARIPDYHRLDLSATYTPKKKKDKVLFFINRPESWESSWTFSLYNVYARRNAYSIYFRQDEGSLNTEAYQLSIFGSIIPAVTYNFNF